MEDMNMKTTWWTYLDNAQELADVLRIIVKLSYVDRATIMVTRDKDTFRGYFIKANCIA